MRRQPSTTRTLTFALVGLLATACSAQLEAPLGPDGGAPGSDAGGETDAEPANPGTDPALEGSWLLSKCTTDERSRAEFVVTGNTLESRWGYFAMTDAACSAPTVVVSFHETITLRGPVPNIAGAKKYDSQLQAATITVMVDSLRDYYNSIAYCGYGDWATGVAKDVAGKTCEAASPSTYDPVGDIYYGIYIVGDDRLTFGDPTTGDGSTEAMRPTQLDTEYYTKQ